MEESAVCPEIRTDGDVECPSRNELKIEDDCLKDNAESESFINKKQAKEEAINDDIKSEVSNPIVSPKEITSSFHDITSQQTESDTTNRVGCDKVTCTSSEETLSEADRSESFQTETSLNNNTSAYVSTSHVVLEIPKHVSSSSGIRKITFKFSKRKEDYVAQSSAPSSHSVYDDLYSYREDSPEGSHRRSCAPNVEIKMSKKVVPNEYPTNVKKLLLTGILDGARVKYISTTQKVQLEYTWFPSICYTSTF